MTKIQELQLQLEAALERIGVLESGGRRSTPRIIKEATDPKDRPDYIAHGSDAHAQQLKLRKATPDDGDLVVDGWALTDLVSYGANANLLYLKSVLRGKVGCLTSKPQKIQSDDPRKPGFAPVMWRPGTHFSQIMAGR